MPRFQRLVHDALYRSAERHRQKVAVVDGRMSYTFGDLLRAAGHRAAVLKAAGIRSGDRVVVCLENGWTAAVSVYAVWMAGGVVVFINPQTRRDKLRFILDDSEAAGLIAEKRILESLESGVRPPSRLQYIATAGEEDDRSAGVAGQPVGDEDAPCAIPTDLAALIYTSGSTGDPKGVMHSHQTMVFAAGSIIEYLGLSAHDRILCVLPLAFDYGLYQLLMAVQTGATLVLERSFAYPAQLARRLGEHRITVFPGVPTLFARLLEMHRRQGIVFPSVERVTNTAAALPKEFIFDLEKLFPNADIYSMYGLTECKRATYLPPAQVGVRPDSVGKAIPGTEVMVLRDDGSPAAPGECGVLHVRGPHVMLGYWKRPEQTERMLRPGRWPGERMLCTHDIFKSDAEGYLYFVGRTDDVIKSRGEKVSPLEVERVLCGIDGVDQAVVIGLPDPVLGQRICACVVTERTRAINERMLRACCAEKLEPFMVPQTIRIVDALPLTPNGKVDKQALALIIRQSGNTPLEKEGGLHGSNVGI